MDYVNLTQREAMKFGAYLFEHLEKGWEDSYIDYNRLKKIIKTLESQHVNQAQSGFGIAGTSLSVPMPTNAAGMPTPQSGNEGAEILTQETFYNVIEQEMRKIEVFTKKQVADTRLKLKEIQKELMGFNYNEEDEASVLQTKVLRGKLEAIGENFLKLEKFVNLNVTGFHKILKKHDRRLPNPCKSFYVARLHDQSWVRGDFSDVIVTMSRAYEKLRGDLAVVEKENEKQDFVRCTRKYWVHMEDISRIKYIILQHLPVFMQKTMNDQDSQLVNSVYLDNYSMELYHGRLDKTPGAQALRMRWYGTGSPEVVFVERKTHRESWCGEVSVKERFIVKEGQVKELLSNSFDIEAELKKMRDKEKAESEVKEWETLAREVVQSINSKQLFPTVRTQYMRTAFQIPFDATVRVSLDTNLCMIHERTNDVLSGNRWYRDPNVNVPLNEITRFPHAVLEVKLQLEQEGQTPVWVNELVHSGMLMEVHKFSKFIHGCAVLLPDEVRAVPYWVDDVTLAPSIEQSGASALLIAKKDDAYNHLLPHDKTGASKARKISVMSANIRPVKLPPDLPLGGVDGECFAQWCDWAQAADIDHITQQKEEPKIFFANERTFIKWLQMAVVLSSISIGVLAFSKKTSKAATFAMMMLPISELFIGYSLWTYLWRTDRIKNRFEGRWDDPLGPVILTAILIIALVIQFFITINDMHSR